MNSEGSLKEEILRAAGPERCEVDAEKMARYRVGGVPPLIVVWPRCGEELKTAVDLSRKEGISIVPAGGMTKINTGLPPRRGFILAPLTRMSGLVDYDPANLTVSAYAGTRLNDLQAVLAKEGQFLPLNPPFGDESTLGGILAANASGPLRLYYGGARDLALGVRVMLSDGRTLRCGSKTVKNVAGYDMVKLFIGSWGTLGVVCEATFRVSPLPEKRGALSVLFKDIGDALATAKGILRSRLSPSYLTVLSQGLGPHLAHAINKAPGQGFVSMVIGAEGFEEALKAHLEDAEKICANGGAVGCAELYGADEKALRRKMEDYPALLGLQANVALLFRVSAPISKVHVVLRGLGSIAADNGLGCEYVADPGLGLIKAAIASGGDQDYARGASILKRVRELARICAGNLLLEHASESIKLSDGVWGEVGPKELSLMRGIKAELDPYDLFCPGRFAGGI